MDTYDSGRIRQEIERMKTYLEDLEEAQRTIEQMYRPEPEWQYGDDMQSGAYRGDFVVPRDQTPTTSQTPMHTPAPNTMPLRMPTHEITTTSEPAIAPEPIMTQTPLRNNNMQQSNDNYDDTVIDRYIDVQELERRMNEAAAEADQSWMEYESMQKQRAAQNFGQSLDPQSESWSEPNIEQERRPSESELAESSNEMELSEIGLEAPNSERATNVPRDIDEGMSTTEPTTTPPTDIAAQASEPAPVQAAEPREAPTTDHTPVPSTSPRSSSPNVSQTVQTVQSILKRLELYNGEVDGSETAELAEAVKQFQRINSLPADGIVNRQTMQKLDNYLFGYDMYLVRRGDTVQTIADRLGSSVNEIKLANPHLDLRFLRPGKRIVVPVWKDTVPTDVGYTYELLKKNFYGFKTRFPFVEISIIGKSVLGKNLYCMRLGKGPKTIFLNASHHGLEWINTPVLMKFAETLLNAYASGGSVEGVNADDIWNQNSIYIVPMVNPDGVNLVINGIEPGDPYYQQIQNWNNTGRPLSEVWNANIRGIDLNRNYDAKWAEAKAQESALGIDGPGPTRFGGTMPVSEPETQAMTMFTKNHNFDAAIAYHTQGETIYWGFDHRGSDNATESNGDNSVTGDSANPTGTLGLLKALEEATGYEVDNPPEEMAYAGYKDWFIQDFERPGFTLETGKGVNPLPISQFNTIYEDNVAGILAALMKL